MLTVAAYIRADTTQHYGWIHSLCLEWFNCCLKIESLQMNLLLCSSCPSRWQTTVQGEAGTGLAAAVQKRPGEVWTGTGDASGLMTTLSVFYVCTLQDYQWCELFWKHRYWRPTEGEVGHVSKKSHVQIKFTYVPAHVAPCIFLQD